MVRTAPLPQILRTSARAVGVTALIAACALGVVPAAGAQEKVTIDAPKEFDGKPLNEPKIEVKPFNECYVKNDDGTVVSYFSYELGSPETADLAAGSGYNFVSGAAANSGQPSSFSAGPHHFVFSVTWDANASEAPVWYLNGAAAGGTDSGTVCKEVPAVPEFPFAAAGPVIAVGAFGTWFLLRRRRLPAIA